MENENLTNDINNTPTEPEKKVDVLRIVSITVNTIFYVFIFLLLLFSITQITGSKKNKIKSIFGLGYESVITDSMYVKERNGLTVVDESRFKNTKTSFDAGDLIWVTKLNKKERKKVKVGNVVTFVDVVSNSPTGESGGFLNTHRIVDFIYDDNGKKQSAVLQGDMFRGSQYDYVYVMSHMEEVYHSSDKANVQHLMQSDQRIQIVALEEIEAKYIGQWKNGGDFVNWLSNPKKGFVIIILLSGAFLLFEMFMVIKNIMLLRTEKLSAQAEEDKEALKDEMKKSLEEERERIRAELMAELAAKEAAKAKDDSNESEEIEKVDDNPNDLEESTEENKED